MAVVPNGRPARTRFIRLERWRAADLVRAELETGRTHQIRVHLLHLGHPVVGDRTYAPERHRGFSGPERAWAAGVDRVVMMATSMVGTFGSGEAMHPRASAPGNPPYITLTRSVDRRLGVDRDAERVVRPIRLGVDLLQLLKDGIGLLDFFWGRHLATLLRQNPSILSFLLIVCWVGSCSSV